VYKPELIKNLFSQEDIDRLRAEVLDGSELKRDDYDEVCNRSVIEHHLLDSYFSRKALDDVRRIYEDESIEPTICIYSKYDSPDSFLPEHVDRNACEFNISYVVSQQEPWPIIINGTKYYLEVGDAITYHGTNSRHSRGELQETNNTEVEMLIFHYVSGSHWFFNHCDDFYPDSEL
jgi:hypothetical protein